MFESLSSKLDLAFKTLRGQGKINDLNVAQTVKEIRRALVDADVNYKIAKLKKEEKKVISTAIHKLPIKKF
jgi:signal recognition particle subunit SRP54